MSNTPNSDIDAEAAPEPSATGSGEQSTENQEAELAAQVDLLAAENRRLRELVAAAQRSRYRDTAIALFGIGLLFAILGLVVQTGSTVLFALAGTGLFGGVLTYFLTPERFISADVGEEVYTATAESFERFCRDLGLSDQRIYISDSNNADATTGGSYGSSTAESWLFVPQTKDESIPSPSDIDSSFLVETGQRGLTVRPTGSGLFTAFNRSLTEPLGTAPDTLCEQLSDAIIEDFELAQRISYDTDPADGRISVEITDALYGDGARFDHPIVSLFAVGLATGLENPIETAVTATDPLSVTFYWEPDVSDQE